MKKYLWIFVLLLFAAPQSHAQGAIPAIPATKVVNGTTVYIAPIPNATVTVCNTSLIPIDGAICSPLASIFSNVSLTAALPNPTNADANGNISGIYVASGTYVVTVSGPGATPHSYSFTIGGGGGSGSGTVNVGPQYSLPIYPNSGTNSVVGPSNIKTDLLLNNLYVPSNACQGGPRPYIDVTCPPYNADPAGTTSSTAAIQAAITAACADAPAVPEIFFPPGTYNVNQPQTPSTSPIFTISCAVKFRGGGGTNPQFTNSPVATIEDIPGASPNAAAVFYVNSLSALVAGVTFNHLLIDGYNEAVSLKNTSNTEVRDSVL